MLVRVLLGISLVGNYFALGGFGLWLLHLNPKNRPRPGSSDWGLIFFGLFTFLIGAEAAISVGWRALVKKGLEPTSD